MKLSQVVAAGVVTVVGLAVMAYASAMPVAYHTAETARLRLSWSARPERIEVCRQLSDAEQAERGEHMRQRVECEGTLAPYAPTVEVDGLSIGEALLRGAGLRHAR